MKKRKAHKNTVDSTRRPVIQWTTKGAYIRSWGSISEAADALKLDQSHITKCCKGYRASHGGYKWSFDLNYIQFRSDKS